MADWNKPALSDAYATMIALLKDRDLDVAKAFIGVTVTNPVADMVKWSTANKRWERYTGTAWGKLETAYVLDLGTGSTINATPIGATAASTAKFSTLESSGLTKLATASRLLVAGATDDGATELQVNGTATFTTQAVGDNSTKGATTAFVKSQGYATLDSPTLTGIPAGPTAEADTNTTQLATCAFIIGQAGSAAPAMNGAAVAGTSTRWSRQDHVHPVDTSRAPLASPTFTGVPAAPTAAVGTDTTQLATCAFVQGYTPKTVGSKSGSGTSGIVVINQPEGAALAGASSATGAIKIALPAASWTNNTIMRFRVEIFDFAIGESFTLLISAYFQGALQWGVHSVTVLAGRADLDFAVRFGHDGVTGCVWIGELSSTWQYLRAYVSEVMTTYNTDGNTVARWQTGWAMSLVTAFDTVEDTITGNLPVAKSAAALTTSRTITLTGDATGSFSFDGSGNVSFATSVSKLANKAPLASPTFTGIPAAPTAAADTNTTQLATCAFVVGQGYAKLASPALTGVPTASTAAEGTNTTQLSTCEFVQTAIASAVGGITGGYQEFLASGTFVVPDGVTAVYLTGIGGGGGGGGVDGDTGSTTNAAGGGGGVPCVRRKVTVTPGASIAVTIGGGGGGGSSAGGTGGTGGTTSFGALLTLAGGGGGGGAAAGGDNMDYVGGAGGGFPVVHYAISGAGASTQFGRGGGGQTGSAAGAAGAANSGAGGGGARSAGSPRYVGGAGGSGRLIVEW